MIHQQLRQSDLIYYITNLSTYEKDELQKKYKINIKTNSKKRDQNRENMNELDMGLAISKIDINAIENQVGVFGTQ